MKNLLLFSMLFLLSSVGYLQAQCPVSVQTTADSSCLFVIWDAGQTSPDTIRSGELVYTPSDTVDNMIVYTDTARMEFICTEGDTTFVGSLEYVIGVDSFACEFEAGVYQPPCPDSVYMTDVQSCLLLLVNPSNAAQLPDSINYSTSTYYEVGTDESGTYFMYSQNGVACDSSTGTPLNGELTIGPSLCTYNAGLLPITILSFDFQDNDGVIELSWEVNSDEPTRNLYLQKSYDGVDWMNVYEQNLEHYASGQIMDGHFTDQSIEQPKLFYRLHISGVRGDTKYSNILPVTMKDKVINTLFFQPQSRSIMIKAGQNFTGEMYLFNTQGQNVMTKQVQMQKNTYQEIDVQGHLTPGIYFVKFDNGMIPPSKIFID